MLPIFLQMLLQVGGPFFFVALQYSSVLTATRIKQEKSVGKLSMIPFLSLLVNSVIWTFYGLLKGDKTVTLPNVSGAIAGAYCCLIYANYVSSINVIVVSCSMVLVLSAIYWFSQGDTMTLGAFGCILAVILMGSPLATLMTVVREKSTDSMPISTSLTAWLNALSWSLYGILVARDSMIYGPNLLGLALTSIQLFLFLLFRPKSNPTLTSKTSNV